MTASAAEVEAAQKAMADHSLKACGRYVGEMHECVCGSRFATVSGWSGHQAQAVADAVVAAAQPRIAADERAEMVERVLRTDVSRSAFESFMPACHRPRCQGRHPSPEDGFALVLERVAERIQNPLLVNRLDQIVARIEAQP